MSLNSGRAALTVLAKLAFFGAAGFAVYSALTPADGASSLFPWDKAAHFAAFYVVTVLAIPAFPRAPLAGLAAGLLGLGGAIELLQALPGVRRDADWLDLAADALGVAVALAPVVAWRLRGPVRMRPSAAGPSACEADTPEPTPASAPVRLPIASTRN